MKKTNIVVAERNPLMLKGIVSFLEKYPWLYQVIGQYSNLTEAVQKCMDTPDTDLLLLSEFPDFLPTPELVRWVGNKVKDVRILTYVDKTMFTSSEAILQAGAKGLVWKCSQPNIINRAIDSLINDYIYCDKGLSSTEYLIKKPVSENNLTVREKQILQLIADGKTNKGIARILNVSSKTVETHRLNLMKKLDAHNGIELLKTGLRMGVCTI